MVTRGDISIANSEVETRQLQEASASTIFAASSKDGIFMTVLQMDLDHFYTIAFIRYHGLVYTVFIFFFFLIQSGSIWPGSKKLEAESDF